MATTEEVYGFLGTEVEAVLAPFAGPIIEQALAAGMDPRAIADAVENAIDAAPYASFANQLYWTFGVGSHFKELNLSQALGLQPADVLPAEVQGEKARTATDALQLAALGWHWNGVKAYTNPEELVARRAAVDRFPAEYKGIDADLRYVAIMTGLLPIGPRPFGYGCPPLADFKSQDLQSWLDMQWALRSGTTVPTHGNPMRGRG